MNITLAVLSWRAHKTLENTLQSYRALGLDKLASQKIIFFQEICQRDREIANQYGYNFDGSKDNIGIARGYKRLVELASEPYFLFLENDWFLLEPPAKQITAGFELLSSGRVDVVRYRHRLNPGDPLHTRPLMGREYDQPTHLLDAVHWLENPDVFTEISREKVNECEFFLANSKNANWTNNPAMFRTEFLKKHIVSRNGDGDLEQDIQQWWQTTAFIVAQGDGLFTHRRLKEQDTLYSLKKQINRLLSR